MLPALAHADAELDVPGLEASDLRGDALVWEDAVFYLEPWENGAFVRFATFGRSRSEEVGRAVPVRIVDSSRRTFVEVELADRSDCTWRKLVVDPRVGALRLFVRREDLAPVLVKPFAAQWSDGTKIRLGPGVPVTPTPHGDYWVALKSDKLRFSIPHASVGYLYKPTKAAEPELTGKVVRLDRMVNVRVGEDSFQVRSSWLGPVPEKKPDQTLLRLQTRCVDMTALVPSNALRPMDAPRTPTVPPPGASRVTGWYIPDGAPLATPGGREIAVAADAIPVSAPAGDTTCFDARLSIAREDETYQSLHRTLKLCTPATLVQR